MTGTDETNQQEQQEQQQQQDSCCSGETKQCESNNNNDDETVDLEEAIEVEGGDYRDIALKDQQQPADVVDVTSSSTLKDHWGLWGTVVWLVGLVIATTVFGVWYMGGYLEYLGLLTAVILIWCIALITPVYLFRRQCMTIQLLSQVFLVGSLAGFALTITQVFVERFLLEHLIFVLFEQAGSQGLFMLYYFVFVSLITLCVYAIPQEILKFLCIWVMRKLPAYNNRYGCIILGVTSSLAVWSSYLVVSVGREYYLYGEYLFSSPSSLVERIVVSPFAHVCTGLWLGTGMSKRYFRRAGKPAYSYLQIVDYPILINFGYQFFFKAVIFLMWYSRYKGLKIPISEDTHYVVLSAVCVLLVIVAVWTARSIYRLLKNPSNYAFVEMNDV